MYGLMLSEQIKSIIKQKCMIQKRVAEKAGYDPKIFNAMLNGRKIIKAEDILFIAKALDVTPNELYGIEAVDKPA